MKLVLLIIGIALGLILLVALSGGLIVLMAYGLGWLLTRFLPFTIFEATLFSLIALGMVGVIILRVLALIVPPFHPEKKEDEEDEEDWEEDWDEDWEEEEEEEEEEQPKQDYPGIPKWRQPTKKLDFSNVKPDDRCPCGSGRKYKNCHGFKAKA